MQTGISNLTSFKSRNSEIRRADDIARRVGRAVPMLSCGKVEGMSFSSEIFFPDLLSKLRANVSAVRDANEDILNRGENMPAFDKLLSIIEILKALRFGNCGEFSRLALLSAKMNGIEDCYSAVIKPKNKVPVDHTFVYVNNGNKPYIIDAWLGIADYVPNMLQKYKNLYDKYFELKNIDLSEIEFEGIDNIFKFNVIDKLTAEDCAKIKKQFPELC